MFTKKTYLELWEIFEKKLKEKDLDIKSFARKWEETHTDDTNSDYRIFVKKILTQQDRIRKNSFQRVNSSSLTQVKEYIKFLDDGYFTQELLEDERPNSWFD